ncbi:MAG: hypothetical protein IIW25_00330 [Bacteroidales bacterium]|nr:hypothetical protein [Bacteroidales bacterium]
MKNNKFTKALMSFVAAFALVFTISSCNQDLMETTYTPQNNDVTFAAPSATYSLEGQKLDVTLQRGVAKEDLSVNLTLNDPLGVYTLSTNTVTFAAGEYEKTVSLTYDLNNLKPVIDYAFTISFNAADKAIAGYNEFKGSAQMPLEYEEVGTVNMKDNKGYVTGYPHKLYLAKYTDNYYMIEDVAGSGLNFEFNIVDGNINITAPKFSGISGLIATGLKFPSPTVDLGLGPVTFWLDCDPNYIATALDENGLFTTGSIIQFDAIYQMGGKYYGWYKVQFVAQ